MSLPPVVEPQPPPPPTLPSDPTPGTPPSPLPPDSSGTNSATSPTGATSVPVTPASITPTNGSTPVAPSPNGLPPAALAALIVGVVIGAGTVLVALGIFVIFYKRRKRKRKLAAQDLPLHGPKNHPSLGPPQHWQHNTPPPTDYDRPVLPKPIPPPGTVSTPPADNFAPDKHFPSPSPGIALGFSQSSFTYEELKMATDNFSDANLLGQGGFGYVHKGVLPNGKEVAIKQLKDGSGQGEREFQAEVEIIGRVHHRHLVSLVGYCISGARRLLVYEFVPNKTMEFHLHGKGRPVMDWPTRMKIALGSARGLAYLHEDCHPKIIHRDIKAANILLDNHFEAMVADFGLAKSSLDTDTHVSTRVMGTFGYLAPEYASSGKLTEKSDIYSFGVLLLELITGLRPIDRASSYLDDSMVDWVKPLISQAIEDGKFDAFVDKRLEYDSSEMTRMVACAAACVRHSARRRPRMSQVVRALEGDMPLDDLTEGIKPGHNRGYSSHSYDESSEYNTMQYKEDMKKFRKLALESEYSGPTSDFGPNPSSSSTEGLQTTQEIDIQQQKSEKDDNVIIIHHILDEEDGQDPTSSTTKGQQTTQEMEGERMTKALDN